MAYVYRGRLRQWAAGSSWQRSWTHTHAGRTRATRCLLRMVSRSSVGISREFHKDERMLRRGFGSATLRHNLEAETENALGRIMWRGCSERTAYWIRAKKLDDATVVGQLGQVRSDRPVTSVRPRVKMNITFERWIRLSGVTCPWIPVVSGVTRPSSQSILFARIADTQV